MTSLSATTPYSVATSCLYVMDLLLSATHYAIYRIPALHLMLGLPSLYPSSNL